MTRAHVLPILKVSIFYFIQGNFISKYITWTKKFTSRLVCSRQAPSKDVEVKPLKSSVSHKKKVMQANNYMVIVCNGGGGDI